MGTITKEILIGVLVSVFATCCGLFVYLNYVSELSLSETFEMIKKGGTLGTAIVLASIPNLFVFWVFLRKKQDYRARGVLLTTIFTALVTMALKFF